MGVTARQLLGVVFLGCIVAALLGAGPLAAWVDASIASGTVVQTAADDWSELTQSIGLDRPYNALRRAVRDAEAVH